MNEIVNIEVTNRHCDTRSLFKFGEKYKAVEITESDIRLYTIVEGPYKGLNINPAHVKVIPPMTIAKESRRIKLRKKHPSEKEYKSWVDISINCPWRKKSIHEGDVLFKCRVANTCNAESAWLRNCSKDSCAPYYFILWADISKT